MACRAYASTGHTCGVTGRHTLHRCGCGHTWGKKGGGVGKKGKPKGKPKPTGPKG